LSAAAVAFDETFIPAAPQSLHDAGVPTTQIEALILKGLYAKGEVSGRDLAKSLGLRFSLIADVVGTMRQQHLITVRRSLGMGDISSVFCLSEAGVQHARAALERSHYVGPAPVPVSEYARGVMAQRQPAKWLTPKALKEAYSGLSVRDEVLDQIGPAVNAGRSMLIYGQPGNGKTYLAEALVNVQKTPVYVPFAIESNGQIVRVFDPVYHEPVMSPESSNVVSCDEPYDGRWILCRRPFIVTGGELTLSMLDLSYDAHAKVYDAPYHLKANNGIYLVDDFGRQQATPAEILNRWIIPMERRLDYLTFVSGGKMSVPFETFLVFSTNLPPARLGDEAFLRRIHYKLHLTSPDRNEFIDLAVGYARSRGLNTDPSVFSRFLENHYCGTGKPLRRCHPRDVISHAIDVIEFLGRPFELTDSVMSSAFESCFAASEIDAELVHNA
jgi:predicted ATPase with chaperone activity